jgi:GDP-mannose 6-dehydrogenase
VTVDAAKKLTIAIVGLGYVGATAAACLASQGHRVVGVDVNDEKVAKLNAGIAPIVEPGVDELIATATATGVLTARTSVPPLDDFDLVIVCVGTPSAVDGSHNMSFIAESARQIARAASTGHGRRVTVAFRSTFRPGTMETLIAPLFREALGDDYEERIELVYNPEFLRESTAVQDYFRPPKIVVGTSRGSHSTTMAALHEGLDAPTFETGFREAEITKFVDNSWHAAKVAFANEVGRVATAYGVDADVVHSIFVSDTKLNISPYYTRPGGAFGGSCLPKDVRAMQYIAHLAGVSTGLIDSLIPSNEAHKDFQFRRVTELVSPGASVLVLGLAFKGGTDDMRESPNVSLVASLLTAGYEVRVFDPVVRTSSLVGQNLGQVMSDLPSLRELLVSEDQLDVSSFDLVVATNATAEQLDLTEARVLDLRTVRAAAI